MNLCARAGNVNKQKEIKHYNTLTYFNNKYKIKMQKIFLQIIRKNFKKLIFLNIFIRRKRIKNIKKEKIFTKIVKNAILKNQKKKGREKKENEKHKKVSS